MFLGLRTVIYNPGDMDKAKAWYSSVLGIAPYFDEPFYVGFNVGGYELGLEKGGAPPSVDAGVRLSVAADRSRCAMYGGPTWLAHGQPRLSRVSGQNLFDRFADIVHSLLPQIRIKG